MVLVGTGTPTAITANLARRKRLTLNLLLQKVIQLLQLGSKFHIDISELLHMNPNEIKITFSIVLTLYGQSQQGFCLSGC
jgi:hypothetical protein